MSWSVDGVPKGIIKQVLGYIPIMVKSKLCNLHGMTPQQLVEHHEEAEVGFPAPVGLSTWGFKLGFKAHLG